MNLQQDFKTPDDKRVSARKLGGLYSKTKNYLSKIAVTKSKLRQQLEELPVGTKITAGGRVFEKYGSLHLMTDSGVLTLSDFTKHFSDLDLINEENK